MTLYNYLIYFILPVLSLSTLLVFLRFFMGRNIADRIITLDLMVSIGIGSIAIYSMLTGQSIFLDIAMVVALIGFLTTVAFSYYLEKRKKND